ncbi:MAG: hypothetical protein Q8R83_07890 [Legionellaceae bacterium]|nr:hypothetical protein [Legionellaceae bacterium]
MNNRYDDYDSEHDEIENRLFKQVEQKKENRSSDKKSPNQISAVNLMKHGMYNKKVVSADVRTERDEAINKNQAVSPKK